MCEDMHTARQKYAEQLWQYLHVIVSTTRAPSETFI